MSGNVEFGELTLNADMAQGAEGMAEAVPSNASAIQMLAGLDMSNSQSPTIEHEIVSDVDTIFASVLLGNLHSNIESEYDIMLKKAPVFKVCLNKLRAELPANMFKQEYALYYSALTQLNVSVFTEEQLAHIIDLNADAILESPLIDLSAYALVNGESKSSDEEKLLAFKEDAINKFRQLCLRVVSIDEFDTACKLYKLAFKEEFMTELTQEAALIMSNGLKAKDRKGRMRQWKGSDDCREYWDYKVSKFDACNRDELHNEMTLDAAWLGQELEYEKRGQEQAMLMTGIDEIDSVYGGLVRGNMFEVMGPPKAGKTTLTAYLAEKALSEGYNVAIWPLEGRKEEWISLITALMVRRATGIFVDKKDVQRRRYETDDIREAVIAAKTALALDISRGRLSFIEGACYEETYQETLTTHWKNFNPFDVIVVDSPILASSKSGRSRADAVAEVYKGLKQYCISVLPTRALALVTAQLKQTAIEEMRSSKSSNIDVDAGGVSAETIRTPDFVVCLISTKTERAMGQVKICDVATRQSKSFKDCYIGAELGCGYFYSKPELNQY